MAQDSKIEWCDHTANLWWGCTEVHAGCDHCYAKAWAKRYQPTDLWGNDTPRMAIKGVWNDLAKYQRLAKAANQVHRVFVGSMMDIAEKSMPLIDSKGLPIASETSMLRYKFFTEIVPNCPNLLFLLLTKRPGNINKYIPDSWKMNPPANVMFGTSIVDVKSYKTLLPQLKAVNGKRFISLEPQIEYIPDMDLTGIDRLIQGGESGPKKRQYQISWAYGTKYQCEKQNVPYFFKQIDKVQAIPDDLHIRQFPVL